MAMISTAPLRPPYFSFPYITPIGLIPMFAPNISPAYMTQGPLFVLSLHVDLHQAISCLKRTLTILGIGKR